MKRRITLIIGILALFCLGFVVRGAMRAALVQEIADAGMKLVSDTANTSDFDAKLYEMAYSSPIAPDKIGLWLEAVLVKRIETFSANGKAIAPELGAKLSGWPLNRALEIDLSNSSTSDETIAKLGKFSAVEWLDLSGTPVTEKTLLGVLENAPNLRKLELKNTNLSLSADLVDSLMKSTSLKVIDVDESSVDSAVPAKLNAGLKGRM